MSNAGEPPSAALFLVPRLYSDTHGDSRFDTHGVTLGLHDHAPPAAPFYTAEPVTATRYIFFRVPPGWVGAEHVTPNPRLVICLSGALRFIGSTGESLTLRAGERMLDLNVTGKGHATEVVSEGPAEGIIIRLD
jgi:hypothetical protein